MYNNCLSVYLTLVQADIGDNANNPVGNRSDDEITYLACRIAETLEKQPVKLMVIACNTFTVVALDAVRELVSVPVIGVSQGVKTAINKSKSKTIGIMATVATVNSHIHKHVALEVDHEVLVWEQPCPELAGLIEQGHLDDYFVREVCKDYLEPLLSREIEVVVLGCTHFPFVQPLLEELTSGRIWFIDPAFETSELVRHRLESKKLFNPQDTVGTVTLYFTKDVELGDTLSASFLDTSRRTIEHITL